jgi:hypothetical protein
MLLYGSTSSNSGCFGSATSNAGNTAFINYLNSANPANYVWFTPSDNHNMHDCSSAVASGDNYLNSLLVGSGGSLTSPNAGTVFSTSLFRTPGTFLYLWWDEYDPSPNVEYGRMIKVGYTSTGGYDEYNSLHTIEANWGLPYISSVVSSDSSLSDVFGSSAPGGLTASFSYAPGTLQPGQAVTFTASTSGGASPYVYIWSFGDGSSATGASATHTYSKAGSYSVTLTATDSNSTTASSAQQVTVSTTSPLSTLTFLYIGLIAGGAISVIAYLAKYHSRNRRLAAALRDARQARSH